MEKGERVGAIYGTDRLEPLLNVPVVEFFGYGTYEGRFDPSGDASAGIPAAAGFTAQLAKVANWQGNPLIKLDSGKYVWGCECWWGSEAEVRQQLLSYVKAGYIIKTVDIDEIRKM